MRAKLKHNFKNQRGGAAIEYIIISTFAAAIAITAVTFMGKFFRERMQQMAEKLDMETEDFDLDLF